MVTPLLELLLLLSCYQCYWTELRLMCSGCRNAWTGYIIWDVKIIASAAFSFLVHFLSFLFCHTWLIPRNLWLDECTCILIRNWAMLRNSCYKLKIAYTYKKLARIFANKTFQPLFQNLLLEDWSKTHIAAHRMYSYLIFVCNLKTKQKPLHRKPKYEIS